MIVIVDYGLGNLRSVAGAVAKVGSNALISSNPSDITAAQKLILPGVGAFGDGMAKLNERGLIEPLTQAVMQRRVPILGICLGAQLLARDSFEFGHHQGLGWIDASVVRIEPGDSELKVPHVGWNELHQAKPSILFEGIPPEALFYYVHSFHIRCASIDDVYGTCRYGIEFHAVIQRDNIYATQFHPEKSQQHGLELLKNFLERT